MYSVRPWNILQDNIKQKKPRIPTNEVLFHQDNVRAHMLVVMMATIRETVGSSSFHICHTHRACPPPLTLSSPKHEKHMTGKRYETDDDVIGNVRGHVEDIPEKSCWNGITKCFQRNNYLKDIQTCYIFHRKKIVITSLRLIWEAQNFSVTPRTITKSSTPMRYWRCLSLSKPNLPVKRAMAGLDLLLTISGV